MQPQPQPEKEDVRMPDAGWPLAAEPAPRPPPPQAQAPPRAEPAKPKVFMGFTSAEYDPEQDEG